jgi:hypothetical protein
MAKLTELTSRDIPGNGGTVVLNMSEPDDGHYQVVVGLPNGEMYILDSTTREQAVQDYWHPFLNLAVPDIFKPELVTAD